MNGMLSGGELARRWGRGFVMVTAKSGRSYPPDHELRKLNDRVYVPVMVFLDAQGNEVHRSTGFGSAREGRALADYVAGRHYATKTYTQFLAAYRDD